MLTLKLPIGSKLECFEIVKNWTAAILFLSIVQAISLSLGSLGGMWNHNSQIYYIKAQGGMGIAESLSTVLYKETPKSVS